MVAVASWKTGTMRIVVLAGGIGGARFLRGLRHTAPGADVTVIGNTADDITLFGLRVCPDLDTVLYTLGGGIHEQQGWGRDSESFAVAEELAAYGVGPEWFTLGDRDLATHIVRTQMLDAGYPLSEVTEALCSRWLGSREESRMRLIPMSDDRVETHIVIDDPDSPAGHRAIHFQEWWIRFHANVPARDIIPVGVENAKPADGVLDAIETADLVLLPPSNPVVSIGTILAVPGIREALEPKTVVGVSPIIGGAPVRGMADACLAAIGVETSAHAVAAHYGPALLDGWLVDETDPVTHGGGITVRRMPLYMRDIDATSAIARGAIDLGEELRG